MDKQIIEWVQNKAYDDLFGYLHSDHHLSVSELEQLWFLLTGVRRGRRSRAALIADIGDYIFVVHNFDDMDQRFGGRVRDMDGFE